MVDFVLTNTNSGFIVRVNTVPYICPIIDNHCIYFMQICSTLCVDIFSWVLGNSACNLRVTHKVRHNYVYIVCIIIYDGHYDFDIVTCNCKCNIEDCM